MKEWTSDRGVDVDAGERIFKVKISTGTASIQLQAVDEGFDQVDDGFFSATTSKAIQLASAKYKVVLTGDARFFLEESGS